MAASTVRTHPPLRLGPLGDTIGRVELLRVSGTELEVVNAARVSLGVHRVRFDEVKDAGLIRYLAEHRHTTPFEHVTMGFRIKCPIFVARQWMRHRMASYNEVSYRYTEVKDGECYRPTIWRRQSKSNRQVGDVPFADSDLTTAFDVAVEDAFKTYRTLLDGGVCREQARAVLPVCTYTEFYFSCNLLSLLNFLRLRLAEDAQWEIRQYAQEIVRLTEALFPVTYRAWGITKAAPSSEGDA